MSGRKAGMAVGVTGALESSVMVTSASLKDHLPFYLDRLLGGRRWVDKRGKGRKQLARPFKNHANRTRFGPRILPPGRSDYSFSWNSHTEQEI
jgi:hypothetical protein